MFIKITWNMEPIDNLLKQGLVKEESFEENTEFSQLNAPRMDLESQGIET